MKFTAFKTDPHTEYEILPAPMKREWMDKFGGNHPYRCLPLVIANQAGWVIPCPVEFTVRWTGHKNKDKALKFKFKERAEYFEKRIHSNFGDGVITFSIPFLLRTEEKMGVLVRGMPNAPKVNCHPLEGYVETDWSPFSFTMNWKILVPFHKVKFEKGEPICFIQPINLDVLENAQPEIFSIDEDPELAEAYKTWSEGRKEFNETKDPHSKEWQKHYYQGKDLDGGEHGDHRTALKLDEFSDDTQ